MRLLFDRNLSQKLKTDLADLCPESLHVNDLGLDSAPDTMIWSYASEHGLMIVTKDKDFQEFALVRGHPPKVIWIRRGNCPTSEIAALLRSHYDDLLAFNQDEQQGLLELD